MMTLQKSSWIEAAEPDVVEIHRSRSPVGFSPDPSTPMTLQAFALVLKGEEGFSVCLALHGREIRRALVYAVDPSPKGHASFAEPLRKGLAALKGLGFDLEPLNLKYSPAMREVVLRDIPVILSPANHRKVQKEKTDLLQQLQRQADDLPGPEEELFDDPQLPATEQAKREQARQARRDAATSALSKLAVEKRVEEQAQALARLLGELFAGKKRALPSPPAEAAKAKAAPARSTAPAVPPPRPAQPAPAPAPPRPRATPPAGLPRAASASGWTSVGTGPAPRQPEETMVGLRQEVDRFQSEKLLAEKRIAELEASLVQTRNASVGGALSAHPSTATPAAGPPPHALRRPPQPGALFRVDWDLAAIPGDASREVAEIHSSTFNVQLSLEGYPGQNCSAYVVVLKTAGGFRVYLPFRLLASNRLLIYVPARQPGSQDELSRVLREARRFLQVVGFEIEAAPREKGRPFPPPELRRLLFSEAAAAENVR